MCGENKKWVEKINIFPICENPEAVSRTGFRDFLFAKIDFSNKDRKDYFSNKPISSS